jgi:hypothetical protein
VFVSTLSELETLKELCRENRIDYISISSTTKTTMDEVWMKTGGFMKLVLATDDAMIKYKVQNAQTLIHFSLPKNWAIFTKRFATCFKYYKTYVASKSKNPVPTAMVMMDYDNIMEVPRMISFLSDHRLVKGHHQMPKEILDFVEVKKLF